MRSKKSVRACACCSCLLALAMIPCLAFIFLQGASEETKLFANPERVTLRDYTGDAMEPFLSRDGRSLFFNSTLAL